MFSDKIKKIFPELKKLVEYCDERDYIEIKVEGTEINFNNDFYPGGGYQLQIVWLDKGTKFRVEEYDGSESVTLVEDLTFEA